MILVGTQLMARIKVQPEQDCISETGPEPNMSHPAWLAQTPPVPVIVKSARWEKFRPNPTRLIKTIIYNGHPNLNAYAIGNKTQAGSLIGVLTCYAARRF